MSRVHLAVLGNSHVACLKQAWDQVQDQCPQLTVTCFASNRSTLTQTYQQQGVLHPSSEHVANSFRRTSHGQSVLSMADYDVLLVHGVLETFKTLHTTARQLRQLGFYSQGFARQCLVYPSVLAEHLVPLLAELQMDQAEQGSGPVPVVLTSRPNPATQSGRHPAYSRAAWADLAGQVQQALAPWSMTYLAQPEATFGSLYSTREAFNQAGVGLGDKPTAQGYKAAKDPHRTHMNLWFGLHYWHTTLSHCARQLTGDRGAICQAGADRVAAMLDAHRVSAGSAS